MELFLSWGVMMTLIVVAYHSRPTGATLYVIDILDDMQAIMCKHGMEPDCPGIPTTHSHNFSTALSYPSNLSDSAIQQGLQNKVDSEVQNYTQPDMHMLSVVSAGASMSTLRGKGSACPAQFRQALTELLTWFTAVKMSGCSNMLI